MATVTLSSVLDTWPAGTTVGAYPQANQSAGWDRASSPSGSTTTTAVVAAGGSLAFSGLADDTAYVAAAQVSSVWRIRTFRSPAVAASVVDQTARDALGHRRVPSQNALKAWTGDPEKASGGTAFTPGRTHWVKCFCEEAITFSTIWWYPTSVGTGGTPANFILGAAAQDGTLLGRTADQSAAGMSTVATFSTTLTAESGQTLAHPGGLNTFFWLGFVVGTAHTTPATFLKFGWNTGSTNVGLTTGTGVHRSGYTTASGATTLATFSPAAMSLDPPYFLAVS
jgi:hypothetical protein